MSYDCPFLDETGQNRFFCFVFVGVVVGCIEVSFFGCKRPLDCTVFLAFILAAVPHNTALCASCVLPIQFRQENKDPELLLILHLDLGPATPLDFTRTTHLAQYPTGTYSRASNRHGWPQIHSCQATRQHDTYGMAKAANM